MASRSNYRVKVDLSKYHDDARRLSWIYINGTNVSFIKHLKEHIVDVFGIHEPFHLLLNGNEYLPPDEDVRVLNENESILVEPGSGICNGNGPITSMASPNIENGLAKGIHVQCRGGATVNHHGWKIETKEEKNNNQILDNTSNADATMYHSMLDITAIESGSDSQRKDEDSTLSCSAIEAYGMPPRKRKRIRRKKIPKQAEITSHENIGGQTQQNCNKPKISNSYTLPAGKHIRFDNRGHRKADGVEVDVNHLPFGNHKTVIDRPVSLPSIKKTGDLSTLLALKQCSTPLIYDGKKKINGSEQKSEIKDTVELFNATEDVGSSRSATSNGSNHHAQLKEQSNYLNVNPEEYPSLQTASEVDDVIAFKILRIGTEYTPEVSDYIIARTVGWCSAKMLYTFQILRGQAEIQGPSGKFSLPENEIAHYESDSTELNFSQLIDPRLINRKQ